MLATPRMPWKALRNGEAAGFLIGPQPAGLAAPLPVLEVDAERTDRLYPEQLGLVGDAIDRDGNLFLRFPYLELPDAPAIFHDRPTRSWVMSLAWRMPSLLRATTHYQSFTILLACCNPIRDLGGQDGRLIEAHVTSDWIDLSRRAGSPAVPRSDSHWFDPQRPSG